MPDYDSPVAHEQKAFGHRVDILFGMAVQRAVMKVLPVKSP